MDQDDQEYPERNEPGAQCRRTILGCPTWLAMIISSVVTVIVVLVLLPLAFGVNPVDIFTGEEDREGARLPETGGEPQDQVSVAREVLPSIVKIDVLSGPGFPGGRGAGATGSGVVYRDDGYIVTNYHVVLDSGDILVTTSDNEELPAEVVGTDPGNDLAVLKVDRADLPAVRLGNSDELSPGQPCVAVGSPFGLEQTVTAGIISAVGRDIQTGSQLAIGDSDGLLRGMIQTDAAINPGNSGGGIFVSGGLLVGVSSVIATTGGGSEGVGFAIPVNTVRRVADGIIGADRDARGAKTSS